VLQCRRQLHVDLLFKEFAHVENISYLLHYFNFFAIVVVVVFVVIPAASHQQRGAASETGPFAQWHPAS